MKIPQDISLAQFTISLTDQSLTYFMSGVEIPRYEMGRKAAELLLQVIETEKPAPNAVFQGNWLERGSIITLPRNQS